MSNAALCHAVLRLSSGAYQRPLLTLPLLCQGHTVQETQLVLPHLGGVEASPAQATTAAAAATALATPLPAGAVSRTGGRCCLSLPAAEGSSSGGDGSSTGSTPAAFLAVCEATGALLSYCVGGMEQLSAPLAPCFYRAATDNDRGGSGGASYVARWGCGVATCMGTPVCMCIACISNAGFSGSSVLNTVTSFCTQESSYSGCWVP